MHLVYLQVKNSTSKMTKIAHFIAQRIVQLCQCQYSGDYIIDGRLFCASKNDVVYQAQLISTDGKTAQEIRNVTQQWVLSKPTIMIDNLSYQVDPNCSVIVKELGETSCNAASESHPTNIMQSIVNTSIVVSSAIGGMMVLLCIGLIIASLCYFHKRKSNSLDLR